MSWKSLFGFGGLCAVSLAFAQEPAHPQDGLSHTKKAAPKPVAAVGPVTEGEAYEVLFTVNRALAEAVRARPVAAPKLDPNSTKPISRTTLVLLLDKLSHAYEKSYKLKARTQYCDPSVLKLTGSAKVKAIRLIKLGFLEPVGPLEVGPSNTLSIDDFGDAVGYFVERWCDVTHMPDIKWSPTLQRDESIPAQPVKRPAQGGGAAPKRPTSG